MSMVDIINRVAREIEMRDRLVPPGSTGSGLLELADIVVAYLDAEAVFRQAKHEFEITFVTDSRMRDVLQRWQDASYALKKATETLFDAIAYNSLVLR